MLELDLKQAKESEATVKAKNMTLQKDLDLQSRENKLNIPVFKSASGQRTFAYRAVTLWNSLPTEITSTTSFKGKLSDYLFRN